MKTLMEQEAKSTADKVRKQLSLNVAKWQAVIDAIRTNKPSFAGTIARGSSDHAASYAKYMIEINAGLVTASIAPSVYTNYKANMNTENALVLGVSQSGKSPDLVQSFSALDSSAISVALVNVEDSPLAHAAKFVIPLHADEEKAVAATKSYITALTAVAQFIGLYTQDKQLLDALELLPSHLEKAAEQDWSYAIEALQPASDAYVIGRGYGYPIAQEAALKFKETACIHSEPFSSAEVLHGPFALVKPNFPVLVFAQNDQTGKATIELAERMTKMGANVMLAMPGLKVAEVSKVLPMGESLHPMLDPILNIQAFYMMAAKLAVARGLNPDQPENLNKVTETV